MSYELNSRTVQTQQPDCLNKTVGLFKRNSRTVFELKAKKKD